jgi:hypothetical protein
VRGPYACSGRVGLGVAGALRHLAFPWQAITESQARRHRATAVDRAGAGTGALRPFITARFEISSNRTVLRRQLLLAVRTFLGGGSTLRLRRGSGLRTALEESCDFARLLPDGSAAIFSLSTRVAQRRIRAPERGRICSRNKFYGFRLVNTTTSPIKLS